MKEGIKQLIEDVLKKKIPVEVSIPAHASFGHYSTNVAMRLSSEERRAPMVIAEELALKIKEKAPPGFFEKVEAVAPGFVNFWISPEVLRRELKNIYSKKTKYGESRQGKGKKVIVEYSSPNIAKPLHTGHLRNTILGDVIANIYAALGYKVIRWNYLGDWGTQFGKVIAMWKKKGSEAELKDRPAEYLGELYVEFGEAAKSDPSLEDSARSEFLKLEKKYKENTALWKRFKKASIAEIDSIYGKLNIKFDNSTGESFFNDKLSSLVEELLEKGIAERSEGAVIVNLDAEGLPPALIQKSDGGSLYHTRDIAAYEYRIKKYGPEKLIYVVGNEQSLHFEQLFAILEKMEKWAEDRAVHVKYGLILDESGSKMSTRKGTGIGLSGILAKSVELARAIVDEKNYTIPQAEKEKIAEAVGIGALKYGILKEGRTSDIVFDWKRMMDWNGDSGPYIQYTHARLSRILEKAGLFWSFDLNELKGPEEMALIKKLLDFPDEIEKSARQFTTNNIALYLYELANLANRFYEADSILKDENSDRKNARLALTTATRNALKKGLGLLGILAPTKI